MGWNNDLISYEMRPADQHFINLDEWYRSFIKRELWKRGTIANLLVSEWLHSVLGRRRWMVSNEIANVLAQIPVDPDTSGIRWPYDAFALCFEDGTEVCGFRPKWIRCCHAASDLSHELLQERLNFVHPNGQSEREMISVMGMFEDDETLVGHRFPAGNFHPTETEDRLTGKKSADVDLVIDDGTDRVEMAKKTNLLIKIAMSAMLLHAARPEFFVAARLPGRERRRFAANCGQPAHERNTSIVKFPMTKRVVVGRPDPDSVGIGPQKRPHYRGWVLRTLRHERFKARTLAMGLTHPRVILIEPTTIHGDELDALQDAANVAMDGARRIQMNGIPCREPHLVE